MNHLLPVTVAQSIRNTWMWLNRKKVDDRSPVSLAVTVLICRLDHPNTVRLFWSKRSIVYSFFENSGLLFVHFQYFYELRWVMVDSWDGEGCEYHEKPVGCMAIPSIFGTLLAGRCIFQSRPLCRWYASRNSFYPPLLYNLWLANHFVSWARLISRRLSFKGEVTKFWSNKSRDPCLLALNAAPTFDETFTGKLASHRVGQQGQGVTNIAKRFPRHSNHLSFESPCGWCVPLDGPRKFLMFLPVLLWPLSHSNKPSALHVFVAVLSVRVIKGVKRVFSQRWDFIGKYNSGELKEAIGQEHQTVPETDRSF